MSYMSTSDFVRKVEHGVPIYTCRALEELPSVRHGFSTRIGGVSSGESALLNLSRVPWDLPELVEDNRRRFLGAAGLHEASLITLSQVHSDGIHIIENNQAQWNASAAGDALVSRSPGNALAVQVADCFPVLIADPDTMTVASIHAGWRGTRSRILTKTVAAMRRLSGSDPASLWVALGAGIRSCCFEVGAEVVAQFHHEYPGGALAARHPVHEGKFLLDLPAALRYQTEEAGIRPDRVFDLGMCTCCNIDEFFSYRREGERSGRMMGLIGRV
jgi:purine-nucleoside/S-methyl-5'-thioadenosine phosphorylase / adenosine deaminase